MKVFVLTTTLLCFGALQMLLSIANADDSGPTVKLTRGVVRGQLQEVNGKKINFFQGNFSLN